MNPYHSVKRAANEAVALKRFCHSISLGDVAFLPRVGGSFHTDADNSRRAAKKSRVEIGYGSPSDYQSDGLYQYAIDLKRRSVKSYKWWQNERSRNLSNRNILVSIRTA
jgi:hypothetical protein